MMTIAVQFLGSNYDWVHLTLLLVGMGIVGLLSSAISRLAYQSYKNHLLLVEMQKDLRKLVMMQARQLEADQMVQQPGDGQRES